jgi:hypothetical protein
VTVLDQARPLLGYTEPRLWTPPLRELTPETSYGFEVVSFAEEIGHPLLPWQQFAVIHGGELLPDGRPRFRIVLLLVSRQNGKTELPVVLSVYWQFRKRLPLILGTSTQLSYAKESWSKAVKLVNATTVLNSQHAPGKGWVRKTNGETESWTHDDCRYKIAAANEEGGRSLTVDRGIADELRQHHTYDAWDAMEPACSPMHAQIWALSNAGDDRAVVLNDHRKAALEFIDTGVGDRRLGLLEWSAPEDADPEDVEALLQANPRVGYGLDLEVLQEAGARAKRLGGKAMAGFKTERMCIRVKHSDPAIDPASWARCLEPGTLEDARGQMALCLELSEDGQHATLAAAAVMADGRVRVEAVTEWTGPAADARSEAQLPEWVRRIEPRVIGWIPGGPAASIGTSLADPLLARGWLPRRTKIQQFRGEVPAVCMGLNKEIVAGTLVHSGQPGLDDQIEHAEWARRGDARVFARRDTGYVDAVYAIAGAVHLARTMPRRRQVTQRLHSGG